MLGPDKPQLPQTTDPKTEEELLDDFFAGAKKSKSEAPPTTDDPMATLSEAQQVKVPESAEDDFGDLNKDEEDPFADLADDEQSFDFSLDEEPDGEKAEKEEETPIYIYENIKQVGQKDNIKVFPLLLAYQKSSEKDWDKFFDKYRKESGLSESEQKKVEDLLVDQIPEQKSAESAEEFLDAVTERYKLEINNELYYSLLGFSQGNLFKVDPKNNKLELTADGKPIPVKEDLADLIPEGKEFFDSLSELERADLPEDKKDLFKFLEAYKQSLSEFPVYKEGQTKEEEEKVFKEFTSSLFSQGYLPQHIEVALSLDTIAMKFNQDVISELLDRSKKTKEMSMYTDILAESGTGLIYNNVRDEILERIINRYPNIKDLQSILKVGEKQLLEKQSKIKSVNDEVQAEQEKREKDAKKSNADPVPLEAAYLAQKRREIKKIKETTLDVKDTPELKALKDKLIEDELVLLKTQLEDLKQKFASLDKENEDDQSEYQTTKKLIAEKEERIVALEGGIAESGDYVPGEKDLSVADFIEKRGNEVLGLKNSVNTILDYELEAIADVKQGGSGKFEYSGMKPEDLAAREKRLIAIKKASLSDFVNIGGDKDIIMFLAQLTEGRSEIFDIAADKYQELDQTLRKKLYIPPF